jgi:hypothetical protein
MKSKNKTKKLVLALAILLLVVFVLPAAAIEPSLSTDRDLYYPGETVTIYGIGFAPGPIELTVLCPDGQIDPIWDVTASEPDGSFTADYMVPDTGIEGMCIVTAIDSTGVHVSTSFYDPYKMTIRYEIVGGGAPTAPIISYINNGNHSSSQILTTTATDVAGNLKEGSIWEVGPNPLTESGGNERWYASYYSRNGTVIVPSISVIPVISDTAGGAISSPPDAFVFTFYHQFGVIFNYSVVGGGSPSAPSVSFTQLGAGTSATAGEAMPVWVDSGSNYEYPNLLTGPEGTDSDNERWMWDSSSDARTGTISGSATINPSYNHQYRLTISIDPPGAGTTTPADDDMLWYNSGTSVNVTATAATGYVFDYWTLDGADVGSNNPISVSMGSAHALVAIFVVEPVVTGYTFIGFLPPVLNPGSDLAHPVVNFGKAGRTYPVKWQLKDSEGNYVRDPVVVTELSWMEVEGLENLDISEYVMDEEAAPTGGTSLRYDLTDEQFIFNWKTEKGFAGKSYILYLELDDGSFYYALFHFDK